MQECSRTYTLSPASIKLPFQNVKHLTGATWQAPDERSKLQVE